MDTMRYHALYLLGASIVFFFFYWYLILHRKKSPLAQPKIMSEPTGPEIPSSLPKTLLSIAALIFILQGFNLFMLIPFPLILVLIGAPDNIFLIALGVTVFSVTWIPLLMLISWVTEGKILILEKFRKNLTRQIGYFAGALFYACALLAINILLQGTLVGGELKDQNQIFSFFVAGYCMVLAWEFK